MSRIEGHESERLSMFKFASGRELREPPNAQKRESYVRTAVSGSTVRFSVVVLWILPT